LKCEKTANVGDILKAVEDFLRPAMERAVQAMAATLNPAQQKVSGSFGVQEIHMKPFIKFEGEEIGAAHRLEFLPEGETAFLELKFVAYQHAPPPAPSSCCVIS